MKDDYQHIYTAQNRVERQRIGALLSSLEIEWEHGESNWLEIWCPKEFEMAALNEVLMLRGEYNARQKPHKVMHQKVNYIQIGVVILLLLILYFFQHFSEYGALVLQAGRASATRISSGELFRGVTALFLHADIKHLLGNVVFGTLALWALSSLIGTGGALFLMILGGSVGNLMNGFFYGSAHNAIGFSTAVFAVWGAVGAIQFIPQFRRFGLRKWIPFAGALGILAMLGSSLKSDVLAHFFGFVAGAFFAFLFGKIIEKQGVFSSVWQSILFLVSITTILLSWLIVIPL